MKITTRLWVICSWIVCMWLHISMVFLEKHRMQHCLELTLLSKVHLMFNYIKLCLSSYIKIHWIIVKKSFYCHRPWNALILTLARCSNKYHSTNNMLYIRIKRHEICFVCKDVNNIIIKLVLFIEKSSWIKLSKSLIVYNNETIRLL